MLRAPATVQHNVAIRKQKAESHVSKDSALSLHPICLLAQAAQELDRFDHRRLGTFLSLAGDKRHALVLFKRLVSVTLDFRVVREQIFTAQFRGNKAVALVVVEPLHDASFYLQCMS